MSIAFARMQTVTKSAGRPMLDKVNYIARRGRYAARGGLVAGPITVLPMGAPSRYRDEQKLWSDAEAAERFGYVIAQEIMVALPRPGEMPTAHARKFCHALARALSEEYRVPVTFALHSDAMEADHPHDRAVAPGEPSPHGADSNEHAHFLVGSRQLSAQGFSPRRHRALLPDIGGRSLSPSAAFARFHATDATNFELLVRNALELYCDRAGLAVRFRLPAVHPGYHVGPTSAVRALINDVEALARRPDAAAIFRKLDRLRLNSEIETRNIVAVAEIDPLIKHLSDRIFTRQEVEDLVHRFCPDAATGERIVEEVLGRSLVFDADTQTRSRFHIMPEFRAMERRVGELAGQLQGGRDTSSQIPCASVEEFIRDNGAQRGLLLLELADAGHADAVEKLSEALTMNGRTVVMATHLNKRREPPRDVPLRALHWSCDLVLPTGCTVLVDEADSLSLPLLEKLLTAAVPAKANLVFCRRTYRGDLIPNPTLSALVSGNHFVLGGGSEVATDLPFELTPGQTIQFVDNIDATVGLVSELIAKMPAGRKVFFLCADPIVTHRLEVAARVAKREFLVGPLVPEEWTGEVMVLYSPLISARHLRSVADLRLRFLVPRTVASDCQELVRQLRLSLAQVTTLSEPVQPASLNLDRSASQVGGRGPNERMAAVNMPWTSDHSADVRSDDEAIGIEATEIVFDDNDDPDPDNVLAGRDDEDDDPDPEANFEPQPGDDPDEDPG